jgi:biopolymer transport protein ExbD
MDFRTPSPKRPADPIVPMINIVFLLLIFFLMTATIAAPLPFPVEPPLSDAEGAVERDTPLYVGPDGALAWGEARDDAVFTALAGTDRPLMVRADRALPGDALARLLRRLSEAGVGEIRLVVGAG